MNLDLDARIDAEHAQVEQAEADALRVVQRMQLIPGLQPFLSSRKRGYGTFPNPWQAPANLSAQAHITRADRPLAVWLAQQAGQTIAPPDYQEQAEAERWAASARAMEQRTADMRAAREQRQGSQRRWSNAELQAAGWRFR